MRAVIVILSMMVGKCLLQEKTFQCGQRPMKKFKEQDVIYKQNASALSDIEPSGSADLGQWPWYGTVYHVRGNHVKFVCGCTLISQKHALTANISVLDEFGSLVNSSSILVRFGTNHQNSLNLRLARFRKVLRIHVPSEKFYYIPEWIILELDVIVKLNDHVQPICVWSQIFSPEKSIQICWIFSNGKGHIASYIDDKTCTKDPANITISYTKAAWYMTHPSDTFGLGLMNMAYWIAEITNLHYLPKVRGGQSFNPTKQYPHLLPRRHCGRGLIEGESTTLNVSLYETPWLVQLHSIMDNLETKYVCPGSLINHRYVLANMFCIVLNFPRLARFGEYNTNTNPDCNPQDPAVCAPRIRDYEIEYIVYNRYYHKSKRVSSFMSTLKNFDTIALIRTKERIVYEDHIQPICLPISSDHEQRNQLQYTITQWISKDLHKETIDAANCQIYENDNYSLECTSNGTFLKNGNTLGAPIVFIDDNRGNRSVQFGMFLLWKDNKFIIKYIHPYIDWIIANLEE